MKGLWFGVLLAALVLMSFAPSASSSADALHVSVTVRRACTVTHLPAAATVRVDCTRGSAPPPVVLFQDAPVVLDRSAASGWPRVDILF